MCGWLFLSVDDQKANQIETDETAGIYVEQNLKHISDLFAKADLAFTSQGRTVYELATMGVPAVVMAQNEREMKHTFAQMNNGLIHLLLSIALRDFSSPMMACYRMTKIPDPPAICSSYIRRI